MPTAKKTAIILAFLLLPWSLYKLLVPALISIHSFLSITRPIDAQTLVVEGWIFDYMLDDAVREIRKGKYLTVVTTGRKKIFQHGQVIWN